VTKYRKSVGKFGEDLAAQYLAEAGYEIVERNWYSKIGEIDIIAKLKVKGPRSRFALQDRQKPKVEEIVVFVEVKTKSGLELGSPAEMVSKKKQKKLIKTAKSYLQEKNFNNTNWRIDVVTVFLKDHGDFEIDLIKNAVEDET